MLKSSSRESAGEIVSFVRKNAKNSVFGISSARLRFVVEKSFLSIETKEMYYFN
jgi:hypothetical protein